MTQELTRSKQMEQSRGGQYDHILCEDINLSTIRGHCYTVITIALISECIGIIMLQIHKQGCFTAMLDYDIIIIIFEPML